MKIFDGHADIWYDVAEKRKLGEENIVKKYCDDEKIEIIGTIPFDRKIAEAYSKGEIIADALPEYRENFETILKRVKSYGN